MNASVRHATKSAHVPYAPKDAHPYHVIGEILYAGVNMRPQRVAAVVQAYTAEDAIVQAGLLFRLPMWLIGRGYPDGPIEWARVCQLHPTMSATARLTVRQKDSSDSLGGKT